MLLKSFKHAIDGIIHTYKNERNFKIHSLIFILVIILGFYFDIKTYEWLDILLISSFVLSAEMFNTAIEHTLDWLQPNYHKIVKLVKDISAGAVLVSAIFAVIIGLIIFVPYIIIK